MFFLRSFFPAQNTHFALEDLVLACLAEITGRGFVLFRLSQSELVLEFTFTQSSAAS